MSSFSEFFNHSKTLELGKRKQRKMEDVIEMDLAVDEVYNVVYEDGSKLETVDPLEIRKSGKVIKRISHKTVFYVCNF